MTWSARQIREVPKTGPHWRSLRLELAVLAFGVNSTHGYAGDLIVLEHDESLTGYEELYVVLTGHARFTVTDEETDAPAGTLVFVHDAGARRRAVALVDDTEILTIGAAPGEPFERSGWEHACEVSSYVNAGDYARGLDRAREILAEYPYDWPVLYSAACSAARLGRRDEALELLRFAYELEPTVAQTAASQPAFDSIRSEVERLLA
ncbi:MAG TPA: hypothetical protein VGJ25_04635 [Gaiellaceae bacterium]